ncbi:MAG: exodeoxyribonuclease V subunit gamma [Fibrobacter sp.]|jgi:exodeoxyribonuclease V gamma subunit|nr:exodeoxyribonuclease V subunit gamma [Fibrobacter sp.]
MSGLNLYSSNRMESLVTILAQIIKEPLSSPLDQEIIVIQNRGMERWLSMQLAKELGIWANCRYLFPNSFVQELFSIVIQDLPQHLLSEPQYLAWKIMQTLPDHLHSVQFKPLSNYLSDSNPIKLFQLSKKIADLFDQYTVYRPEMIMQWEQDQQQNHWQAILWRTLFNDDSIHLARLKQSLFKKLTETNIQEELFPQRVSIFGISALPPFHTDLFNALSTVTEVNFFVLNPCAEYWDDILSEKEITKLLNKNLKRRKKRISETQLHLERGNTLLSSWGKYGRDFLARLHQYSPEEYSFPIDNEKETLLATVQSDILNLRERGTPEYPPCEVTENDNSIQIHCCHSPMREVEVLYDNILNFFRSYPGLQPSDIVVMSPDIETYAPYIDAVFGSVQDPALRIPYTLADRNIRVESTIAESFLTLLELPGSRFAVSSVIDLLETREIQSAFSISENDLPVIKKWISETGIRWGIDKHTKERLNLPPFDENTWSYGLNRLLMGYSLPSGDQFSFMDIAGYDHLEGSQSEILGNFLDFIEKLTEFMTYLEQDHTLIEWSEILIRYLNSFFKTDQDHQNDLFTVQNTLIELDSIYKDLNYTEKVPLDILKNWLSSKLQQQSIRPAFITGNLTFCALLPMRSVPFRIVCLLGLDDQTFPRRSPFLSWNLIAANPKPGDRSLELEDRYLFLEALLSARDLLYISYTGQSPYDNVSRRPSVIIEELLDYLDKSFLINTLNNNISSADKESENNSQASDNSITSSLNSSYYPSIRETIITKHRLQAFSPAYFEMGSKLFSFSTDNYLAALNAGKINETAEPFFTSPLPEPDLAFKSLQINELCRFFQNPARYLLQRRLHISLDLHHVNFDDDEPFDISGIDRYKLTGKLIDNLLSGMPVEECYKQFKIMGELPHGTVGKHHFDIISRDVSDFVDSLSSFKVEPQLDNLLIDNDLSDFHLYGSIQNIWKNHQLQYRFARFKAADLLNLWVRHLLVNHFGSASYPKTSLMLTRDECIRFGEVKDSEQLLHKLLDLYWKGLSSPLLFFPESSWEFAETILLQNKPEDAALYNALKKWNGDSFMSIPGESQDPYNSLSFGSIDSPLEKEDFKLTAMEIFEPLISNMELGWDVTK